MDLVAGFNLFEAVWWFGLGITLLAVRVGRDLPRYRRWLAVVLIVFGVSDLIEVWSGAWWRPLWLAALKTACVGPIAVLIGTWYRAARRGR